MVLWATVSACSGKFDIEINASQKIDVRFITSTLSFIRKCGSGDNIFTYRLYSEIKTRGMSKTYPLQFWLSQKQKLWGGDMMHTRSLTAICRTNTIHASMKPKNVWFKVHVLLFPSLTYLTSILLKPHNLHLLCINTIQTGVLLNKAGVCAYLSYPFISHCPSEYLIKTNLSWRVRTNY